MMADDAGLTIRRVRLIFGSVRRAKAYENQK
jgi:hypothetical protein